MRNIQSLICLLGMILPASGALADQTPSLVGKFSDGKLTASWNASGDQYVGTIALGNQEFQAAARQNGVAFGGDFVAEGNRFAFSAMLDGDTLTLTTGGTTYMLQRQAPTINPLAGGPSQQPVLQLVAQIASAATAGNVTAQNVTAQNVTAGNVGAGNLPEGYTVVSTTAVGRVMSTRKRGESSVATAMNATLPELASYFDDKPHIVQAYEDTQNQRTGGISFTASLRGQPVNGLVTCKLDGSGGASISVLYCNANATAADWKTLTGPAAGGAAAAGGADAGNAAGSAASAASVPLQTYQFPDNSGSIGLAQGWTTQATSCHGVFVINGPADQAITLGFSASVVTPDSDMVRMNQQLNYNSQRMGGRPIPFNLLVAPYDTPVNVMKTIMPQLSATNARAGRATLVLDHVGPGKTIPSIFPNGRAADVRYGLTITSQGQSKHQIVVAEVQIAPVGNGSFMFTESAAAGPDATFNSDFPIMLAMMNSLHENAAVIQQQTNQQIAQMNQRFAAQQRAQKTIQQGYDDYNKDMAKNELITERSNTDFDEIIRGTRDIEDTETGDKTSVNLGDAGQIVDNLNAYQPGRYKQIPLRDEMFPLPGNDGQ